MAFELTEKNTTPADRNHVHIYDIDGGSMNAGDRIQVRADFGEGIIVLMDELVPAGKVWNNIHFQFQAVEDSV